MIAAMLARKNLLALSLGFLLSAICSHALAAIPSEKFFPENTCGYFSVRNVQELRDHFEKTQIGQLAKDPTLQPFIDNLRHQIRERLSGPQQELGITLEDVASIATGEVAVGVIFAESDERPGLAAVINIAGKRAEVEELLERVLNTVRKEGGTVTEQTVGSKTVHIVHLAETAERPERNIFYYLDDDLLFTTNRQEQMKFMLGQLSIAGKSLADVPSFLGIMQRCNEDLGDNQPQIRWFIEPFNYTAAMRAAIPQEQRRRQRKLAENLKAAGFSVLQGLGGVLSFASEDFELIHRTFIFAPGPFEKSAQMLDFPNNTKFPLPPFVPRDLATFSIGYCNILKGFDNIGPVFDQTVGEGEEGVWADVLESLKEDPNGPQIDLREEFFKHLGQRVTIVTSYQLPITPTSERMLIAIEVNDEKAASKGLDKMFQFEERFRSREHKGHVIWEGLPEEKAEVPRIELGGVPRVDQEELTEQREEVQPLFPNASLTVYKGHLLIGSHFDYLTAILDLEEDHDSLARNPAFLQVMETIDKIGGQTSCWRFFSLTDEEYRATYELIRQGKMPEGQTMLARVLNAFLAPPEKGAVRKQRIDGSKLPDYEIVRRHLGPAGLFVKTEENGWFIKGFTLPKK